MSWKFDMPNGVFKNHSLSSKLREQAVAEAVFAKFASNEPSYGKGKGDTHTITRIAQLALAGRVDEMSRLPSGRPAMTTKSVTVSEWGFKIPITNFEQQLAAFDIKNPFQSTLKNQIKLTIDKLVADTFKLTPVKYVPTTAGFTLTTNGTAGTTSTRNLQVSDLRAIHDYLASDLLCPPYANGKYVGILSVGAARGLKNDPEYKDWIAPTSSEPLMSGQLKDIEGFTLIESNHASALDSTVGASTTTGEAVFFGSDAVSMLEISTPEIAVGIPEDLGRFQEVGWSGIFDAFLVWEQATQARVIHVSST